VEDGEGGVLPDVVAGVFVGAVGVLFTTSPSSAVAVGAGAVLFPGVLVVLVVFSGRGVDERVTTVLFSGWLLLVGGTAVFSSAAEAVGLESGCVVFVLLGGVMVVWPGSTCSG
jgi:hypothetical protein